jgi:hypothetical protein
MLMMMMMIIMMMIISLILQSTNQGTNKRLRNTEQSGVEVTINVYSGIVVG